MERTNSKQKTKRTFTTVEKVGNFLLNQNKGISGKLTVTEFIFEFSTNDNLLKSNKLPANFFSIPIFEIEKFCYN